MKSKKWIAKATVLLVLVCGRGVLAQTLGDTCQGYTTTSTGQMANMCQAAYASGNNAFVMYNNSKVWGAAAVNDAYGCFFGDSNSCKSATTNAYQSKTNNNLATGAYQATQWMTWNAMGYQSKMTALEAGTKGGAGGTPLSQTLPEPCQAAASGGAVADRIACAVATDPSIPSSVQSPQFLSNFQNATGVALQDVINKSPAELLDYVPGALEHAYGGLKGQLSLSDFLGLKGQLLSAISEKRGGASTLNIPSVALAKQDQQPGGISGVAAPSVTTPSQVLPLSVARSVASVGGMVNDAENHPEISLFARVTYQYRQSPLFRGDFGALPGWDSKTN